MRDALLVEKAIGLIIDEYMTATAKNGPFNSAHEAYAVILEELEELWLEVMKKDFDRDQNKMLLEAKQVAAMGIRFMVDVCMKQQNPRAVYLGGSIYGKKSFEDANNWRLEAAKRLEAAGYVALNPLRDKVPGMDYNCDFIVERDLDDIRQATTLIVEMNTPGVPIAGTSMEIRQAHEWGKRIILWGDANKGSHWLQYHASAWVPTLDAALKLLNA